MLHIVQSGVLAGGKVFTIVAQMLDGSSHLIARIADGFQLANLAEHNADFILCLVRKVVFSHLFKIVGYLNFHVVGNGFVVFYTLKLALKLLFILLVYQRACHTKHALHALGKMNNLLLRLQNRYFGGCHHAAIDEMKGGVGLGLLLVGQKAAH